MFIQTETTPNPATLKFLPGCTVMPGDGTANFVNAAETERSPLAQRLFELEGVAGVFLGADFVTVTKEGAKDWEAMKPQLLGALMDHFSSGRPAMEGVAAAQAASDDPLVAQIKELLDTRVRPAVAQDGGDIIFRRFENGVVYLHMQGSCSGCPSSTATLQHGIENLLRHFCPEVQKVQAV